MPWLRGLFVLARERSLQWLSPRRRQCLCRVVSISPCSGVLLLCGSSTMEADSAGVRLKAMCNRVNREVSDVGEVDPTKNLLSWCLLRITISLKLHAGLFIQSFIQSVSPKLYESYDISELRGSHILVCHILSLFRVLSTVLHPPAFSHSLFF